MAPPPTTGLKISAIAGFLKYSIPICARAGLARANPAAPASTAINFCFIKLLLGEGPVRRVRFRHKAKFLAQLGVSTLLKSYQFPKRPAIEVRPVCSISDHRRAGSGEWLECLERFVLLVGQRNDWIVAGGTGGGVQRPDGRPCQRQQHRRKDPIAGDQDRQTGIALLEDSLGQKSNCDAQACTH